MEADQRTVTDAAYVVWVDRGCEGWHPTACATLEEAVAVESYGSFKVVTKRCRWTPVESADG